MAERPPATVYLDSGHFVDWTSPVTTSSGWSSTATVDKTATFTITFPTKPITVDFQQASARLVRDILDDGQSFFASMWGSAAKGFVNDGLGGVLKWGGDSLAWATQIPDNPLVRARNSVRDNNLGGNPLYASAPLIKGCHHAGCIIFYLLLLWLLWKGTQLLRRSPKKAAVAPRRWGIPMESEDPGIPPAPRTPASRPGRGPDQKRP